MTVREIKDRTFLVTGGAGFIGSHLVEFLLEAGAERVVALDNLRCGNWENLRAARRKYGLALQELTLDFARASEEELLAALHGVDYLYHLAAEKHNQALHMPDEVFRVNVSGTYRLYEAAVQSKIRKIVYASSVYVYGRDSGPPMKETDIAEPNTIYGTSKLAGEHLLRYIEQAHQIPYTALRVFFSYGAREFAGMGYRSHMLTNFGFMLAGKPPVIQGDGEQAMDFVYVTDVARAFVKALDSDADGEAVNIGSGVATTMNELAEKMLAAAESSLKPVHDEPGETAGTCRVADIDKARTLLGWQPEVSLEAGLREMYQWLAAQPVPR